MTTKKPQQQNLLACRMAEEENIRQRVDDDGNRWTKVYFGGGAHFKNWLRQFIELKGESNVKIEEADPIGLLCYGCSGEKMYRIWVKTTSIE